MPNKQPTKPEVAILGEERAIDRAARKAMGILIDPRMSKDVKTITRRLLDKYRMLNTVSRKHDL